MKVKIKETGEIFDLGHDKLGEYFITNSRGDFANGSFFVDNNDGMFTCGQKTFVLYNNIFEELTKADKIINLLKKYGHNDIASLACKKIVELPFDSFSFENMSFCPTEEELREGYGEKYDTLGTLNKFPVYLRFNEFCNFDKFVDDELDKKGLVLGYGPYCRYDENNDFLSYDVIIKRSLKNPY